MSYSVAQSFDYVILFHGWMGTGYVIVMSLVIIQFTKQEK